MYTPLIAAVGCYFDKRRRFAMAVSVSGAGIGSLCFPHLTQHLIKEYGWRGCMLVCGGIAFNFCICGVLIRPLPVNNSAILIDIYKTTTEETNKLIEYNLTDKPETEESIVKCDVEKNIKMSSSKVDSLAFQLKLLIYKVFTGERTRLFKDIIFLAFFANNMMYVGSAYIFFIMINDFVMSRGLSHEDSAFILSIFGIFNMGGRLSAGVIGLHPRIDSVSTYCCSMVLMGVISVIIPITNNYASFGVVTALFGAGYGMAASSLPSAVGEVFGTGDLINCLGLIYFASGVGGLISPPFAGTCQLA